MAIDRTVDRIRGISAMRRVKDQANLAGLRFQRIRRRATPRTISPRRLHPRVAVIQPLHAIARERAVRQYAEQRPMCLWSALSNQAVPSCMGEFVSTCRRHCTFKAPDSTISELCILVPTIISVANSNQHEKRMAGNLVLRPTNCLSTDNCGIRKNR